VKADRVALDEKAVDAGDNRDPGPPREGSPADPRRPRGGPLAWLFTARREGDAERWFDRSPDEQGRDVRDRGERGPGGRGNPERGGDGPIEQREPGRAGGPPAEFIAAMQQAQLEARSLLTELVAEVPGNPRYQLELARSYLNAIRTPRLKPEDGDRDAGRDGKTALTDLQKAIGILDALVTAHPDDDLYRIELADALTISSRELERHEPEESELKRLRRSVEVARELYAKSPDVPRYADRLGRSLRLLAAAQSRSGHDDDAGKTLRESIAVLQQAVDDRPGQFAYRFSLARTLEDTSRLQRRSEQRDEASKSLDRAISVIQSALPELDGDEPPPPAVRGMYGVLMTLLHSAGRDDEADRLRERMKRFSRGGPPHLGGDGYHPGRPEGPPRFRDGDPGRFGPPGNGPRRPGPPPERPPGQNDSPPPQSNDRPDNRDRPESSTAE
jgi:tetratricopeptide (TPR) repeat protein